MVLDDFTCQDVYTKQCISDKFCIYTYVHLLAQAQNPTLCLGIKCYRQMIPVN